MHRLASVGFVWLPWLRLASLGCVWLRLASLGFAWLRLGPLGFGWLRLASLGFAWLRLALLGFARIRLASLGWGVTGARGLSAAGWLSVWPWASRGQSNLGRARARSQPDCNLCSPPTPLALSDSLGSAWLRQASLCYTCFSLTSLGCASLRLAWLVRDWPAGWLPVSSRAAEVAKNSSQAQRQPACSPGSRPEGY